jgi:hypothetical protein
MLRGGGGGCCPQTLGMGKGWALFRLPVSWSILRWLNEFIPKRRGKVTLQNILLGISDETKNKNSIMNC